MALITAQPMKTAPIFNFEGWIKFETQNAARKACRELIVIHGDLCSFVRRSELEPKMVYLRAADGDAIKRLANILKKTDGCGWKTTPQEKMAMRELDIQTGIDMGHHGKVTQRNAAWFFVTAKLGETFDFSEAFSWAEIESRARTQGWEIMEISGGDRRGQIIKRSPATL